MKNRKKTFAIHFTLIALVFLTLAPFFFMVNSSFLTRKECRTNYITIPRNAVGLVKTIFSNKETVTVVDQTEDIFDLSRKEAIKFYWNELTTGPKMAWEILRGFTINSIIVSGLTVLGVCLIASTTSYILARYKFRGSNLIFLFIISTMMFPSVMYLVPQFLLVKKLNLINTYWGMVLPYISGGLVIATFMFRSFFEGLPEELFESARIDGAGHFRLYWNIILPMSKPVFAVVIILNVIGTWSGFIWPFIVNPDTKNQVIGAGLYVMQQANSGNPPSMFFAAYTIASIPLLILFMKATKPFVEGMSSGAFKA